MCVKEKLIELLNIIIQQNTQRHLELRKSHTGCRFLSRQKENDYGYYSTMRIL